MTGLAILHDRQSREYVDGGDTLMHALDRAVAARGDEIFLDFAGRTFTYRQTKERAVELARGLRSLGVGAGDRVVTQLRNSEDVIFSWFGTNLLGAVWVPVNTAYRGEFLRHQIADSGAEVVICETEYTDGLLSVALPDVRAILVRGAASEWSDGRVHSLDSYRIRIADGDPVEHAAKPSDLTCLLYTSGTTGPSKGCMMSTNYLCNMGYHSNTAVPPLPNERNWTCNPMFHMSALGGIVATLLNQGSISIVEQFSVSSFWSEIERSGATTALLLGPAFNWLANADDTPEMLRCVGQLRAVTGYVAPEVAQVWRTRFGVKHMNRYAYGQTEGVWLTVTPAEDTDLPAGCVGRICEDFDIRAVDDNDVLLPDGQPGEIVFRPKRPNVMFTGYWKRPDETAKVWRNLWMHTGDIGFIQNGYLFFVDRKKDYLRSRGENISSFEVERTYQQHPSVSEAAVYAVGEGVSEGEIKVSVVLRDGASLSCEELCTWSIEHLPYFAVPRYFEIRDELIKTPTGKIQKFNLRAEGISESTWDRVAAGITVRRR
ncbi:ATP-dependent acyl-CoA ligase [Rhodococcus olei]|uniref:ATP-dependent acyl-CoA ligase n=1 Tax=Rhodococcus olei TaxID=2161675 RepID=A0ABP8PQZ9_9NOCA